MGRSQRPQCFPTGLPPEILSSSKLFQFPSEPLKGLPLFHFLFPLELSLAIPILSHWNPGPRNFPVSLTWELPQVEVLAGCEWGPSTGDLRRRQVLSP